MRQRTGAQPVVAIRRPGYRSCVWTKRGSGVSALSDLRGRSIAMEDVGSTSAHLGPAKLLLDAGVDPQRDVEVRLVGDAMQEALERGDVDAVGAGCHDYEAFMENEDRAAYPLVTEGPELPADVIVAREGLPGRDVARVRRAFERHWPGLRAAMAQGEENAKFRDAELVAVPSDADYDVVREMYRAVGVEDFTRFVGD
jgi:phosphonate transport system substrate-binding protein